MCHILKAWLYLSHYSLCNLHIIKSHVNPSQPFSHPSVNRSSLPVLLFLFRLFCCCPLWTDGIASPFGSTHVLLSLLQLVSWVPRGDRQQMKALILTSARAKPWIFNLLWHYSVSLCLCLTVCLSVFFYFFIFFSINILSTGHSLIYTQLRGITPGTTNLKCSPWPCACALLCVFACANRRHLYNVVVLQGFAVCVICVGVGLIGGGQLFTDLQPLAKGSFALTHILSTAWN